MVFKFHCDSINILQPTARFHSTSHLNSTVILLISSLLVTYHDTLLDLNSTVILLILESPFFKILQKINLNSTVILLIFRLWKSKSCIEKYI